MTRQHQIEGTDKLLMDTIQRQAGDIVDGWRELLQNGIDSPGAGRVELDYTPRHTVVTDDGDGVDLDTDRGLALLKNLGETTKDGDADTIGEFGVGKGQAVAKGRTVFMSGTTALHFDVKSWGLTVKTVPLPDDRAVDGFEARVAHYGDEVPRRGSYKWDSFGEDIAERFKFVSVASDTDVVVNGDVVSGARLHDEVGGDYSVVEHDPDSSADFMAALQPDADGGVSVYSAGLYVTDVDGHGVGGAVVTRDNLMLNHARNEIQSGCPVWAEVDSWLDDKTVEVLDGVPEDRLSAAARGYLARRSMSSGGDLDTSEAIFKTVDGRRVSLDDISEASSLSFARGDDARARKLAEGWNMTILDSTDDASARLKEEYEAMQEAVGSMPDQFDVDEKADEVSLPDTHEVLDDGDLNSLQSRKLAAARHIAREIGVRARVKWGESEVSDAWRENNTVVIADGAAPSRARSAFIPEVFRAVAKEGVRSGDTRGDAETDLYDRSRMAQRYLDHQDVMTDLIVAAERRGLAEAVDDDLRHLATR
jgi:hypothetical protein